MQNKLVEIKELIELLGCEDERTVKKWCNKNKLPLFKVGKKTYTVSIFLELFIMDELSKFVKQNFENPDKIMDAIKEDNKAEFSELVNAPVSKKVSANYQAKTNSKAAQDYINQFKAA